MFLIAPLPIQWQFAQTVRLLISFIVAVVACGSAFGSASKTETNFFGFTGPETFPIDNFIANLRAADFDGDGLNDLAVANNSRSKITILYNQTGKTNTTTTSPKRGPKPDLNELPPDARFRIESIASEKR